MAIMRAKMKVSFAGHTSNKEGQVQYLSINMHAVYSKDAKLGEVHEDNNYSKFTPAAQVSMHITNPELFDKFKIGDCLYVDFSEAPQ